MGRSQGGLSSKIHLTVDEHGMSTPIILTWRQDGDTRSCHPTERPQRLLPLRGRSRSKLEAVLTDNTYSHPSTREPCVGAGSGSSVRSGPTS